MSEHPNQEVRCRGDPPISAWGDVKELLGPTI